MEAAATAKKRKCHLIDGQEPLGIGNGVRESSLDLINRLPDEVLGTVISLLPTKEGARTQAVSRRWRPLWRAAPLNLGADRSLSGRERKRVALVSKILSDHPGPARRFALPGIRLRERYARIDRWLRSRALTGLREIEFSYEIRLLYMIENAQLPYPLPPSVFRFAPTLCVASIGYCDFPREMAPLLKFSCLKQLSLCCVLVLEDALHNLLCGCPVLESLLVDGIVGVGCLRINSPTLRSIGFRVSCYRTIVENHTNLQHLRLYWGVHGPATFQVVRAPKLEILGFLSIRITKLELGTTVFQKMIAQSVPTSMRTLKVLALDSWGPNLDSVVDFLKCFPCLQKLYIRSKLQKSMENKRSYSPLDPIECLESHLRQVVMMYYEGMGPDVDFAKFFVLNAKVLQKMVFGYVNSRSDKWMANQHGLLQLDNRASQGAQFEFRRGSFIISPGYYQHTHNLWMDDPFYNTYADAA